VRFFTPLVFLFAVNASFANEYQYLGSSYNSFGQVGLIQTPTADSKKEGSIFLTINKNNMWKFGTLTASPFNWLEASYFYYRPSDLAWEVDNIPGHYLDKGFNVKFKYTPKNSIFPNLAIGLDDFAGTGYFAKEYVVATQELPNTKISLGMGWGKFATQDGFKNPFSLISEEFGNRPEVSVNFGQAGNPSYDQWFRGPAKLFGGIEYFFQKKKGLSLKLELDPYDYLDFSAQNRKDALYDLRKKDSQINIGFSYPLNKFVTIDASYIKGNTFNISFSIGASFNESLVSKKKFDPSLTLNKDNNGSEISFYESLLLNLNNNNLLLQTASLEEDQLDISISTSQHRSAIRSSIYASSIAKEVLNNYRIDANQINISHINAGIELNNIKYITNHINNNDIPVEFLIRNIDLDSGDPAGYKKDKFKPIVEFPVIFSSLSPTLITHIGNPNKFFFGGINLQHLSEIQFKRNLLLTTELNKRVYDNLEYSVTGPASLMENVRTEVIDYLKEDSLVITRMQLDYIWSPKKDFYAKISGGIFETMFAGYGIEALYKPFDSNFDIGIELFHVKQRSFNQLLSFKKYQTLTGHINFGYSLPFGIESKLSYGSYLAQDVGYTFDLGRRTSSGFKAGIYFTRTNVSAETFGEGSFDKGFYFQIPLDLFSKSYSGNYASFKLSPLTRDGGAKLAYEKDLRGLIYNSTYRELNSNWRGLSN
jgi:hypothetical protein